MKYLLPVAFSLFTLLSCSDKSGKSNSTNPSDSARTSTGPSLYEDSETASFQLLKEDSKWGWQYRTDETTYKVVNVALQGKDTQHYMAKYRTVTNGATSLEGQKRTIQIELRSLDNPKKIVLKKQHDCDEIIFDWKYYKTIKYGCCGSLDQLKLYDYQGKLLIEGVLPITTASVPNRDFRFYISFQANEDQDSTTIGTLQLSYNSSEIYRIQIKSANHTPSENCGPYTLPILRLKTGSTKDDYNEQDKTYSLWSLEHQKALAPDQLNGLTIRANFDCDPTIGIIDIPIINGQPFGKAGKNQVYQVK
ncbi:hypothetical protein [Spirosoma gilvum]